MMVQYETIATTNTKLWIFKKALDPKDNRLLKTIELDFDKELAVIISNSNI